MVNFGAHEYNKKITVTFDNPLQKLQLDDIRFQYLENSPLKKVIIIPKESVNDILPVIMSSGPNDLSIEEEEVGTVVERIYGEGSDVIA